MTTIDRCPDAKPETQRRRRFTARDRKRLMSLYRRSRQTASQFCGEHEARHALVPHRVPHIGKRLRIDVLDDDRP